MRLDTDNGTLSKYKNIVPNVPIFKPFSSYLSVISFTV